MTKKKVTVKRPTNGHRAKRYHSWAKNGTCERPGCKATLETRQVKTDCKGKRE